MTFVCQRVEVQRYFLKHYRLWIRIWEWFILSDPKQNKQKYISILYIKLVMTLIEKYINIHIHPHPLVNNSIVTLNQK